MLKTSDVAGMTSVRTEFFHPENSYPLQRRGSFFLFKAQFELRGLIIFHMTLKTEQPYIPAKTRIASKDPSADKKENDAWRQRSYQDQWKPKALLSLVCVPLKHEKHEDTRAKIRQLQLLQPPVHFAFLRASLVLLLRVLASLSQQYVYCISIKHDLSFTVQSSMLANSWSSSSRVFFFSGSTRDVYLSLVQYANTLAVITVVLRSKAFYRDKRMKWQCEALLRSITTTHSDSIMKNQRICRHAP